VAVSGISSSRKYLAGRWRLGNVASAEGENGEKMACHDRVSIDCCWAGSCCRSVEVWWWPFPLAGTLGASDIVVGEQIAIDHVT